MRKIPERIIVMAETVIFVCLTAICLAGTIKFIGAYIF